MKHSNHSHHTRTYTHNTLNINRSFVENDRRNHSRICMLTALRIICQQRTNDNRSREIENCGISVLQPIIISYLFDLLLGVIRVFVRNQIKIAFGKNERNIRKTQEKPNIEYSLERGKITVPFFRCHFAVVAVAAIAVVVFKITFFWRRICT